MHQDIVINQSTASLRRILFVAELAAARNTIHRLALNDISTADTFTLTVLGVTTGTITFDANTTTMASNISTAIGTTSLDAPTVTHVTGNTYDIEYTGAQAAMNIAAATINSPTTFTPTGVTVTQVGGVINSPAMGEVFTGSDIQFSKNGDTLADALGTFVEIGKGGYYYIPTTGEIDTQGFFFGVVNKTGISTSPIAANIVAASEVNGETIIATGTAQSGSTANDIKLAADTDKLGNYFVPCRVDIIAGTGANQGGKLGHSWNNSTKLLGIEPPWVVTPDNTSEYKLTSVTPIQADALRVNHATPGTFGGDQAAPSDIADEIIARGNELATEFMDLADGVEVSLTLRQAMRLLSAVISGEASVGGGGTTVTFRNVTDTKDRVIATVDTTGQRTAITTDPD